MADLSTLHIFGADIGPEEGWRLVRWCWSHGADEFNVRGLVTSASSQEPLKPFDDLAAPFRLPMTTRRDLSGKGTSQELWTLNEATLEALKLAFPLGIFDYDPRPSAWFEDLTLYRAGELMLGIIAHEGEGVLRLTPSEAIELREAGFPTRPEGQWVGYV